MQMVASGYGVTLVREAAWATLLAVGQTGTADVRVVELVLPELIDDAAKMIPPYQAPGT
jgi:hypothetical protein